MILIILIFPFLAGCTWFSKAEKIEIENPKPGTILEIKEEAIQK